MGWVMHRMLLGLIGAVLLTGAVVSVALADKAPLPPITISEISSDQEYGRIESKAIRVGGGPSREREYLMLLRGPNGESVRFERDGSCCGFETPNGIMGGGLLDIYSVWTGDASEPDKLYINMYDYEQPKAPKGFTFVSRLKRK
jgi:hypothetical protein